MSKERYYVYVLRCSDNSLYTGWTNNLEKRLSAHNRGLGAKYTRGRVPVEIVYFEEYETRPQAQTREVAIKSLPRSEKIRLIQGGRG